MSSNSIRTRPWALLNIPGGFSTQISPIAFHLVTRICEGVRGARSSANKMVWSGRADNVNVCA